MEKLLPTKKAPPDKKVDSLIIINQRISRIRSSPYISLVDIPMIASKSIFVHPRHSGKISSYI
jgi:hypothetical protein